MSNTVDRAHAAPFRGPIGEYSGPTLSVSFGLVLLERLRDSQHGKIAVLACHDLVSGTSRVRESNGVAAEHLHSYGRHPSVWDLWLRRSRDSVAPGVVWTDEETLAEGKLEDDPFFTNWLRPQGVAHFIGGVIARQGAEIYYVVVGRDQDTGAYGQRDVAFYRALLPHIQYAAELGFSIEKLRNAGEAHVEMLDLLPVGVVLLDRRKRPIATNRHARNILGPSERLLSFPAVGPAPERNNGQRRANDDLPAWAGAEIDLGPSSNAILLKRHNGQKPLSAVLCRLTNRNSQLDHEAPGFVIFISDPDNPVMVDPKRLSRFYGLTPAEARMTALLAEGRRLDVAASELGITLHTARTHLKRIFGKMGAQSQADLVRIALDISTRIGT